LLFIYSVIKKITILSWCLILQKKKRIQFYCLKEIEKKGTKIGKQNGRSFFFKKNVVGTLNLFFFLLVIRFFFYSIWSFYFVFYWDLWVIICFDLLLYSYLNHTFFFCYWINARFHNKEFDFIVWEKLNWGDQIEREKRLEVFW